MRCRSKLLRTAILLAFILPGLAFRAYAAETVVDQLHLKFIPDSVSINAGDTIRFTNSEHLTHNVTIVNPDGTSEDKGMQNFQQEITVAFAKAGTYQVICSVHPAMKLTVTVK